MLKQRVDDKSFIWLVKKWLKAGILEEDGEITHPITGTPQGGIISPVLANIYMHYVLNIWFEKVVKKYSNGKAHLCVYADDFICVFGNLRDATRFYKSLSKRFDKFGLELAQDKTNIINFIKWANTKFDFLGFEFRLSNARYRHIKIRTSKKKLQNSIKNVNSWCRENRCNGVKYFFSILNAKL
jgi:RNA-directed DNA polymerase